jgi:putative phosphoribosyl transferase
VSAVVSRETHREIQIPLGDVSLNGTLSIPASTRGLVLFAHGSGSGRFSPRNRFVAEELQKGQLATLLLDLLTEEEERIDEMSRRFRFDIKMLGSRFTSVTDWVRDEADLQELDIGYFGASTGAAAALMAAAERPQVVSAVVSRGGRPDLAFDDLSKVRAPTLLIVGENDQQVIEMNRSALLRLTCEKGLELVPGASHLFEEPGTLEKVALLATYWFQEHFSGGG